MFDTARGPRKSASSITTTTLIYWANKKSIGEAKKIRELPIREPGSTAMYTQSNCCRRGLTLRLKKCQRSAIRESENRTVAMFDTAR